MAYYIGTKLVKAEESYKYDGKVYPYNDKCIDVGSDGKGIELGYAVQYSDGYISWSPKEVFEKAYLKVDDNPKLPSDVSIGSKMVDDFIQEIEVQTLGEKTTLVRVVLVNGFEIIESSACVDAANYSQEIGAECCLEKIKDKIWMLLGFLLQTAHKGVK